MVIQHKCPGCGSDMFFDAETKHLTCPSCGHSEDIENMPREDIAIQTNSNYEEFVQETSRQTYGDDSAQQYQCKNCGAILITNRDTSATICSFCDSPMIIGDRLTGELSPSKVIPFSITKEQAEAAFKKWCNKSFLIPNAFKKANRLKTITGIYVPFWLFDLHSNGQVQAECTKVRHYTRGDYNITETKYFDVFRQVDLHFKKIPVDASIKMDDAMMDKLEPFDYSNLKDFNTPYLSGYLAEKYDYTDKDLFPRVKERADQYTLEYAKETMTGYDGKKILQKQFQVTPDNVNYTLLPVWMLCYDYENSEHNFLMNGQTGKIIGKPPLSKYKCAFWFFLFSMISFMCIRILSLLIGGV